jgi:hypothetical protein
MSSEDIFEKYTNSEDTDMLNTETGTGYNTDMRIDYLLRKMDYSDIHVVQDALDETIKLLKIQEKENDILRVRCKYFQKHIEEKHEKINSLNTKINELVEREKLYRMDFFNNYK